METRPARRLKISNPTRPDPTRPFKFIDPPDPPGRVEKRVRPARNPKDYDTILNSFAIATLGNIQNCSDRKIEDKESNTKLSLITIT